MPIRQNSYNQPGLTSFVRLTAQTMFGRKMTADTPTDSSQVATKGYVDSRTYAAQVNSGGTFGNVSPAGWSVSRTSTGTYVIVHNLGNDSYTVIATPASATSAAADATYGVIIEPYGVNSFTIEWAQTNSPSTAINTDFNFLLTYAP